MKTNAQPRGQCGQISERDDSPSENALLFLSPLGISGWHQELGRWVGADAAPSSPTYYVASTGSNTAAGTTALTPLATVSEALRRLSISGWTGQATIIVSDSVDEGEDPTWYVPSPTGSAKPILIQGVVAEVLGTQDPTGGTAGTIATPTTATVTSAAPGAANVYQGTFMRFTAGTLSGARAVIASNDGAGGFTLGGTLSSAPGADAAERFVVEGPLSGFTFSGTTMNVHAPAGLHLDRLTITAPDGSFFQVSGLVQSTGCVFESSAIDSAYFACSSGVWVDGCSRLTIFDLPDGVTACGSYIDGTANDLLFFGDGGAASDRHYFQGSFFQNVDITGGVGSLMQFETSVFDTCAFPIFGSRITFNLYYSIVNTPRSSPTYGGSPINMSMQTEFNFAYVNINGSTATAVITSIHTWGTIDGTLIGANAGATRCLDVLSGSNIRLLVQPTMSPGAAANACKVGALAAATWAAVFNGGVSLQATQTDLANAASQMVRIGP